MKKEIKSLNAPAAIGPYSQAIEAGDTIYLSGQLGINPITNSFDSDDIKVQTKQALENIKVILAEAGCSFDNVVKSTVLLADINDFASMNEVYGQYFTAPYPARMAYEVGALPKNGKVEIEVVAVK